MKGDSRQLYPCEGSGEEAVGPCAGRAYSADRGQQARSADMRRGCEGKGATQSKAQKPLTHHVDPTVMRRKQLREVPGRSLGSVEQWAGSGQTGIPRPRRDTGSSTPGREPATAGTQRSCRTHSEPTARPVDRQREVSIGRSSGRMRNGGRKPRTNEETGKIGRHEGRLARRRAQSSPITTRTQHPASNMGMTR